MLTSAGVLMIQHNEILLCHVPLTTRYDIPKGKIEKNETPLEACIRETYEETGIKLDKNYLKDLGRYEYLEHKDLYLFLYNVKQKPNVKDLECKTYQEREGIVLPEIDKYEFVNINNIYKYVSYNLHKCIKNAFLKYKI